MHSMCTTCMSDALRGQKRVIGILKLELQMVVSCHVDAENQTRVHCLSSRCS